MSKRAGNKLRSALDVGILGQNRVFRDSVGSKEKSDFYSFRLGYSSNFNLRLDRLKADVNVMLMNGQGKMMMQSKRPKRQPEAINTVLGAGTYYVRVFPARRKDKTRYQLRLSATTMPQPVQPPPVPAVNSSNPNPPRGTERGKIITVPNSGDNPEIVKLPEDDSDGGKIKDVPGSGSVDPGSEPVPTAPVTGRLITGTIGSETLQGGAGNDVIAGINGFDLLIGGTGADRFMLGNATSPYYLGSGYAVIADFNSAQGDEIIRTNNVFYPLSSYRFEYDRFFLSNAFGQSFDIGTAALDTAIYWNNDLLAIVQDTNLTL
jgi:hypothetical protein